MYYIPCLRYKLSDTRLLDHDVCPRPTWTTRWRKMELVDIKDWRSQGTKRISITQDVGGLSIELTVREFVRQTGDALARYWVTNGTRHSYQCTPFAIENMTDTGEDYKRFVDANLASAISHYTEDVDPLIRDSYKMAYRYSQISEVRRMPYSSISHTDLSIHRKRVRKSYSSMRCACGWVLAWKLDLSASAV